VTQIIPVEIKNLVNPIAWTSVQQTGLIQHWWPWNTLSTGVYRIYRYQCLVLQIRVYNSLLTM